MNLKILLASLISISLTQLLTPTALAQEAKFSANYSVTYTIQTGGTTVISQNIDLRNLTSNFYATEYSLSIGATKIKNVSANDSDGSSIPVTVSTEGEVTKIKVTFNKKVVGLNRVLSWRLRYESDDIAVKNGFVWDVTIPKLSSPENIGTYSLVLRAPKEIGIVASISPEPTSTGVESNFNTYTYNKEQLAVSGVNASFGDHQVFNFTLKYHLANSRFFPVIETVALPPDTETQTVIYSSLTPTPQEITVDTDGNYLAKFRLNGGEKLDINLTGQAKIWNQPKNPARTNWTDQELKKYTLVDKYWETNFPAIIDKARELKTAQAIYDYVTSTLKYDYERASSDKLERMGAAEAIGNPTRAVCMEYTDLFIALARSAGIPARELDGFAYTTNAKLKPRSFSGTATEKSDILHAWAQYWNSEKKMWVSIDPTWGSTTGGVDYFNKLDMNHFAFVIKGLSSVEPYPAGSYKTDPSNQNSDVEATLAPAEAEILVKPSLRWEMEQTLTGGLPFGSLITIENPGNATIFGAKLTLQSNIISFASVSIGPIPPLSKKVVPTGSRIEDFGLSAQGRATVILAATDARGEAVTLEDSKDITVQPFIITALPWFGGGILLTSLIIFFRRPLISFLIGIETKVTWLLKEKLRPPRIPV